MAKQPTALTPPEKPKVGRTLTFALTNGSAQVIQMPYISLITPAQKIQDIKSRGGFWVGDDTGNTPGAVYVLWSAVAAVTIS